MMFRNCLLLALAALATAKTTTWKELHAYTFADYVSEFGRDYAHGSAEHATRAALFHANLRTIRAHNADPEKTWKMGVNAFTDRTPEEVKGRKGLDRASLFEAPERALHRAAPREHDPTETHLLPLEVDWRTMGVVTDVKDQGQCGSCWTFAATEVLESSVAIATGNLMTFSEQQWVSCVNNTAECGGTGGCEGGTAEMVYAAAITEGITTEDNYPYTAKDDACKSGDIQPVANVTGQVRLPRNKYAPLLWAVATQGPIAISVDAGWSLYESGVFAAADGGTTIDHAVVLVGYGTDEASGTDFWLVRNSWGPDWGEDGYIRLERRADGLPCGVDEANMDGVGCAGDPDTVEVCGTSAILYDTSYPTGAYLL
jgi:cathepsin L